MGGTVVSRQIDGRPVAAVILALCAFGRPSQAQLVVKLSPRTLSEFESYAAKVKAELQQRWNGKESLLYVDQDAKAKQQVLSGELFIQQMNGGKPAAISDGLIHDWLGAIYFKNRTPEQVVSVLEDFDRHKDFYPAVAQSRTVLRDGHHVTGYWQLRQKGIVPVVLDVDEDVTYQQIAPGKWRGEAYGRRIVEHDTGLFAGGRKFPPDEGHGYLWRLYSYWTFEAVNGGVIAECRTLSLSRDVPAGLNWAVGPYIEKTPRDSLASTLKQTRTAVEQ